MIPDPYFEEGMTRWQVAPVSVGSGTIVTVNDSVAGKNVFQNDANALACLTSTTMLPVNRHHTYEVRGSFRRSNTSGAAGTVYLAVRLFDDAKVEMGGDGTWWFYPAANVPILDAQWHTYSGRFGSGTSRPLPPNARYMTVGAQLNYDNSVPGNRLYQVTGLGIWPVARSSIYTPSTAPGCPAAKTFAAGDVLMSQAFVLDRPADANVNIQLISVGTGERDTGLYIDGAFINQSLAHTASTLWGTHRHTWVGTLGEGPHTIQLRVISPLGPPNGYGCGSAYDYIATTFSE